MAGLSYVGNFSFAQRLLGLPTSLIGNSIADVFRQKAGEVYRKKGECSELFIKTGRILFLIGIIPLIIMLLFAPEIFAIVFGEQWRKAGEIARILSPLFFFRIIVSPLSYLYTLSGHMREDLIIHLGSLGVITGGFIVTNHFFSNKDFLLAGYSTAYFGIYLIYLTRSFQFSKGN
jgi:O-antigen/teichoic acid export membrane protein